MLTLAADTARERYQKIHARFAAEPSERDLTGLRVVRQHGRDVEVLTGGDSTETLERLRARAPDALTTEALSLEEIFIATVQREGLLA